MDYHNYYDLNRWGLVHDSLLLGLMRGASCKTADEIEFRLQRLAESTGLNPGSIVYGATFSDEERARLKEIAHLAWMKANGPIRLPPEVEEVV